MKVFGRQVFGVWIQAAVGLVLVAASAGAGVVALGPRTSPLDPPRVAQIVREDPSPPVAASKATPIAPSVVPTPIAPLVVPTPIAPPVVPPTAPLVVPPTAPPELSTPTAPPADPYADVPVTQVGSIAIPAIGVDLPLFEGIWLTVIDRGPAHWPGTAAPGGWGNVVVAAHRTTHGGPFKRIGELVPGQEIVLRDERGTYTYVVTGSEVVTPLDMRIVDQEPGHTITLFACHPIGSAAQRLVVHGELVAT